MAPARYSHWDIQQPAFDHADILVSRHLGDFSQEEKHHAFDQLLVVCTQYGKLLNEQADILARGLTTCIRRGMYLDQNRSLIDDLLMNLDENQKAKEVCTREYLLTLTYPQRPMPIIVSKEMEVPVITRRAFLWGDVDVLIRFKTDRLVPSTPPEWPQDPMWPPSWITVPDDRVYTLAVECKSAIYDPGEVLRQVKHHRVGLQSNYPDIQSTILCPDPKYAQLFRDHGIGFIPFAKPGPEQLGLAG